MEGQKRSASDIVWLTVRDGFIDQKLSRGTPPDLPETEYKVRTLGPNSATPGVQEYYTTWSSLTVRDVKIEMRRGKFGLEILLFMTSGDSDVCLALSYKNSEGQSFSRKLKNIRINEPMRLTSFKYTNKDTGRETTIFDIHQADHTGSLDSKESKVKDFYNYEDLPKPIMRHNHQLGKDIPDYTERDNVLILGLYETLSSFYPGWQYDKEKGYGKVWGQQVVPAHSHPQTHPSQPVYAQNPTQQQPVISPTQQPVYAQNLAQYPQPTVSSPQPQVQQVQSNPSGQPMTRGESRGGQEVPPIGAYNEQDYNESFDNEDDLPF